jgi:hypothetical protein
MSKTTIVFEGGIGNIRTKSDRSLSITLHTPELNSEQVGNLFGIQNIPGHVVISTNPVAQEMIDAVEEATLDREFESKTPSQRLRSILYVAWEQERPTELSADGSTVFIDFDVYYKRKMNKIINHYKERLS